MNGQPTSLLLTDIDVIWSGCLRLRFSQKLTSSWVIIVIIIMGNEIIAKLALAERGLDFQFGDVVYLPNEVHFLPVHWRHPVSLWQRRRRREVHRHHWRTCSHSVCVHHGNDVQPRLSMTIGSPCPHCGQTMIQRCSEQQTININNLTSKWSG